MSLYIHLTEIYLRHSKILLCCIVLLKGRRERKLQENEGTGKFRKDEGIGNFRKDDRAGKFGKDEGTGNFGEDDREENSGKTKGQKT